MKKILVLFVALSFFATGCTNNKDSNNSTNSVNAKELVGYWLQIEEDWSGDVTDLTDNPYAYLEITEDQLIFYTISFNEDEGYTTSEKYYKLENNKLYYDYYELKGSDWKDKMNEDYGGIFYLTIKDKKIVLTEYNNDIDDKDGYKKDTYKKISRKDWPIEE